MHNRENAERMLSFHTMTYMAIRGSALGALCFPDSLSGQTSNLHLPQITRFLKDASHEAFPDLLKEFHKRSIQDYQTFLKGYHRYLQAPRLSRDSTQLKKIWQQGSVSLIDYAAKYPVDRDALPVLFVPSLINKGYILDLLPGNSLFEYLAAHNIRPLMVDWGAPEMEAQPLSINDYVQKRLLPLMIEASNLTSRPPVIVGYCLGGTLLLRALQYFKKAQGMGLLAVPWQLDNHHQAFRNFKPLASKINMDLKEMLHSIVPQWALQTYFHSFNPAHTHRKFQKLAFQKDSEPDFRHFIAVEDWLNDNVALGGRVAADLLSPAFSKENNSLLQKGGLQFPSSKFIILPARDKIVPEAASKRLVEALPNADLHHPPLGHVGMIVSKRARKMVWEPLKNWLQTFI